MNAFTADVKDELRRRTQHEIKIDEWEPRNMEHTGLLVTILADDRAVLRSTCRTFDKIRKKAGWKRLGSWGSLCVGDLGRLEIQCKIWRMIE